MPVTVWLAVRTLHATTAGGHIWVYLNWALGLRSLGCQVVWLELTPSKTSSNELRDRVGALRKRLEPYGIDDRIALCSVSGDPIDTCGLTLVDLEAAAEADVLLNLAYGIPKPVLERFRRTALIDIDPGLFQIWLDAGKLNVGPHDVYFSIGETVGRPNSKFPDCGLEWHYTPPCVSLDWWPTCDPSLDVGFRTVSNWYMEEWIEHDGEVFKNDKRAGFLPFIELPRHTAESLELILHLAPWDENDRAKLTEFGWQISESQTVAATPWDYQKRIQESRGEFSCAKPSCMRLQNAWISDRTLCFLASGKPVVVQHTGPSRFLPDSEGIFRFRDIAEAARYLTQVANDYDRQCAMARRLAEEYFDARKIAEDVLERALA